MLRILSDLHVYDGMSRVRHATQLDPLFDGADGIILNGDTCDTQHGASPEQVHDLRTHLTARAPSVTFITGNHDPEISSVHEQQLAAGRVWATHGDIFFPEATPWSRLLPELRRRIATERAADPTADPNSVDWRLRTFRRIARGLPIPWDLRRDDFRSKLRRIVTDFGSPGRIWAVLKAWRQGPRLGATMAERYRPAAQVIVFGHVHRPGVAQIGPRTMINTGAFAGALGAWCVDVHDEMVQVRRIEERRGTFWVGAQVTEIPLAASIPARFTNAT